MRHTRASLEPAAARRNSSQLIRVARSRIHIKSNAAGKPQVIVLDDVLTTGATSAAAVESLVRAGAERVDIVVIAAVS